MGLIARQGNTTVFLRAGHHDAVYDLANKSAFVVPEASEPGLVAITSGVTDLDGEHLGRTPAAYRLFARVCWSLDP